MEPQPLFVYAYLNSRIAPLDRGERYEDPLEEALQNNGMGEVTGGGTMQKKSGEVSYCGIDIDLFDAEHGVPFLADFLSERGAPKGSKLQFTLPTGEKKEVPFGNLEGLAIYLNGTDLPDDVYKHCDINYVWEEIDRLIGEKASIQGHWQGATETALYLYGPSATMMRSAIVDFAQSYPLFERARYEIVAQ
jgi:hypothetical protein